MKFSEKFGNGAMNKWLNFGGNPNHRLDTVIVFRIRRYCWEIRKVVNGHKSAGHTNSPGGGTGKTCLGGGMHRPSASSCTVVWSSDGQTGRLIWSVVMELRVQRFCMPRLAVCN